MKARPAVAVPGAESARLAAVPGFTVMAEVEPVSVPFTVSIAVMVWLPAVFSVAENVPVPLVNVELAGRTACPSVLVK